MGLSTIGANSTSSHNTLAGSSTHATSIGGVANLPTDATLNSATHMPVNRMRDVTVVKPIVIGTYSTMFSQQEIAKRKNRNDFSTHKWTCLVRSPLNEDMSYFIRKIVFVLHSSFVNPHRTIYAPPYEVQEIGWGEFEIVARIFFVDPSERPVELRHWLRLYPPGVKDFEHYIPPEGSSCVVSERLDEIFFNDPNPNLYDTLMHGPFSPAASHPMESLFLKSHGQDEYLSSISAAETTLQQAIESMDSKALELTLEIARLKEIHYALNEDKAVSILVKEENNSNTVTPQQPSGETDTSSKVELPVKSEPPTTWTTPTEPVVEE